MRSTQNGIRFPVGGPPSSLTRDLNARTSLQKHALLGLRAIYPFSKLFHSRSHWSTGPLPTSHCDARARDAYTRIAPSTQIPAPALSRPSTHPHISNCGRQQRSPAKVRQTSQRHPRTRGVFSINMTRSHKHNNGDKTSHGIET